MKDWSEAHLQQQLKIIEEKYGSIAVFIHLHPLISVSEPKKAVYFSPTETAIVQHVFLMAKHLKTSLKQASDRGGFSGFMSVARLDGSFGLEPTVNFGAMAGGLFGLVKSLNYEWSSVFCRAIDLSSEIDAAKSANYIIAELHDPNRYLTEVGYGSGGRKTLVGDFSGQ